jgi:hypothetical protein
MERFSDKNSVEEKPFMFRYLKGGSQSRDLYMGELQHLRRNIWTHIFGGKISYPTLMYDREFLRVIHDQLNYPNPSTDGIYDESLQSAEDRESALQTLNALIANPEWRAASDDLVTVRYRVHRNSITSSRGRSKRDADNLAIEERHLDVFPPLQRELIRAERRIILFLWHYRRFFNIP